MIVGTKDVEEIIIVKIKIPIAVTSLLLGFCSYAMELDFSTSDRAKVELEKSLELCHENLKLLDRLISDKKGTTKYNDRENALADSKKLEVNAIQLSRIAQALEKYDRSQYTSELNELISTLEISMNMQNDLINLLK
jgi:hypothetical protein